MWHAFLNASTLTLIIMGVEILTKQVLSYKKYLAIFALSFAFTYSMDAMAIQPKYPFHLFNENLDDLSILELENKAWYHLIEAEECIQKAKEISILFPCTSDREKADYCFKILMGSWVSGTPQMKLLAIGLAFLSEYIPACVNEWHKLMSLLEEAKYHYEMAIFYNQVLRHHEYSAF